jgi:hypothetical protein
MRHLTADNVAALHRFAEDGDVAKLPADGGLRVVCASLPDRHVVSIVRQGDVLWVIIDLRRDDALGQLRQLVRTWPLPAVLHMPFVTPPTSAGMLVG